MATLGLVDLFIVVGYMVVVVAIGLSFARKEGTSENHFLAGRSLTWPVNNRTEGVCFEWSGFAPVEKVPVFRDHRLWIVLLVISVVSCWIIFR